MSFPWELLRKARRNLKDVQTLNELTGKWEWDNKDLRKEIDAALKVYDAEQAEKALADSYRWFEVNDGGSLMAETETHKLFIHLQKSIETGELQYRWVCLPWAEGARGFSDYLYEDSLYKAKVAAIRFSRGER